MQPDAALAALARARTRAMARVLDWFRDHGDHDDGCDYLERAVGQHGEARAGVVLYLSDDLRDLWTAELQRRGQPPENWRVELDAILTALLKGYQEGAREAESTGERRAIADAVLAAWHNAALRTALSDAPRKPRLQTHGTETIDGLPIMLWSLSRGSPKGGA